MKEESFSVYFEHRGTYLYVKLTGKDSFDASLVYWHKIAEKVRNLELDRVLVHEDLEGSVTEGEMFEIMQKVIPEGMGIQVAFFDANQADLGINELGHLIATNRGADIRIFQTLEDAEAWIGKDGLARIG